MSLIDRYIARNFGLAAGLVLLLLLALFTFMSLTEELEDVGSGSFSMTDAIAVVILTTPARIIDLLPVAALLGAVLGLGAMANHRELIALRAAGVSPWRLARGLCALTAVVIVMAMVARASLIPVVERQAQEFRSKSLSQTALGGTEFWSRHENRFIRVGGVDFGRIPRAIEIYELSANGRLQRLLQADSADVINAGEWLLHDVEEKILGDDTVEQRSMVTLTWRSFLTPEQLSTLIAPAHALSVVDLYHYIKAMQGSGVDTHNYQSMMWQQLSLPPALLAMTLLGLLFVLGSVRVRSAGFRTLIGATGGIAFYLFEQITGHLSLILDLPPAPTALAPALVILLGALIGIGRMS